MFDLFGAETPLAVRFFIAFIVVFALIGAAAWLVRRFGANRLGGAAARGRQPRLAVIEAGAVDGRRKLVIVRRDNVEHLIMIGGPTDILIEANIVRGHAANREVAQSRGTGAAAAEETLSWNLPPEPHVPMPAPPLPPRRPARQPDTLAGLAHELSRPNANSEQASPAAARPTPSLDMAAIRPSAPQAQPAAPDAGGDQNLADMAQRLEAALRRPGALAARPATTTPAPNPALASAPRTDSVNGARDKAAKPEPAAAPDQGGAVFGSLEQEMANLLGRPSGKA